MLHSRCRVRDVQPHAANGASKTVDVSRFFSRCGSGLSGECLTEQGHVWVGMDISRSMLGEWIGFIKMFLSDVLLGCFLQTSHRSGKLRATCFWETWAKEFLFELGLSTESSGFTSERLAPHKNSLSPLSIYIKLFVSVFLRCSGFAMPTSETTNPQNGC